MVNGEGRRPGMKRLERDGKGNKDRQEKSRTMKAKSQSPSLNLTTSYSSKHLASFPSLGFLICRGGMTVCPVKALLGIKGTG